MGVVQKGRTGYVYFWPLFLFCSDSPKVLHVIYLLENIAVIFILLVSA